MKAGTLILKPGLLQKRSDSHPEVLFLSLDHLVREVAKGLLGASFLEGSDLIAQRETYVPAELFH